MSKPTGYFCWALKGETGCNLVGFETLTIARGVIMLTTWNQFDNPNPIDAMVFKIDDIKDIMVVEIEAFRNSDNDIGAAR